MNYCMRCGTPIQPGYSLCPNCSAGHRRGGTGIDNIFTAIARERSPGVIREFTLWCIVCFIALMALIASIIGQGNITWILLLVFSVGLGVLMAFRLKPIAMLYSIGVFNLLLPIIHYACFAKSISYFGLNGYVYSYGYSSVEYSPLNIALFTIVLIISLALVICGFVFNFTRVRMENLLTIGVIVDCGLTIVLEILMYAAPSFGTGMSDAGISYYNSYLQSFVNYRGYWMGTISLWCMFIVVMLFYIFFFWGAMGSNPRKIRDMGKSGPGYVTRGYGSLRGICGIYAGKEIPLNGRVLTIGSGSEVQLRIPDAYVSKRHCAIRYNGVNGLYEIQDISTNGVFLGTGVRLRKGVYTAVAKGSIICIGSQAQQFRLM